MGKRGASRKEEKKAVPLSFPANSFYLTSGIHITITGQLLMTQVRFGTSGLFGGVVG